MLDDECIGRIRQAIKHVGRRVAAIARATKLSRKAVAAAVKRGLTVVPYKRKTPGRILARRKALLALTKVTSTKGHRQWPMYSSSKQLRAALAVATGEVLTDRQVRNELKALGLRAYARPVHSTRSRVDIAKRTAFGKKYRRCNWKLIVFSDESWLCCNERTGKVQWCKRRVDALPMEQKARWNVASIMVWGTVGYNWKGPLIVFPSKCTLEGERRQFRLDARAYVSRCLSKVVAGLKAEGRLLQQDGARSHVAAHTQRYLAGKGVAWMKEWPPYSPDLNAIERIWKELNARVGARCPMTEQELIRYAKEEWEALPQELINRHCKHFHRQLKSL